MIKHSDKENNPFEFQYRTDENGTIENVNIDNIREFGIGNILKYQRHKINIDRSPVDIRYLSNNSKPEFRLETLFLQILIEGSVNLYSYKDGNLRRFFFKEEDSDIKPLIYKKYRIGPKKVSQNVNYKQELYLSLNCTGLDRSRFEKLGYDRSSLVSLFKKYYECMGKDYNDFSEKYSKSQLNIYIRSGLNFNTFSMASPETGGETIHLEDQTNLRFGLEFEWILPIK
ncbi:MAG: hypothetical protein AAF693_15330, partial [Bacteroidota bacterium]